MSGKGKGGRGKGKAKGGGSGTSTAAKAGLQFPCARLTRYVRGAAAQEKQEIVCAVHETLRKTGSSERNNGSAAKW